jgi:hypothetical protein
MATRYQHVTDTIRHDVARQVDGLTWRVGGGGEGANAASCREGDGGPDEAVVPVARRNLALVLSLAELGHAHADQSILASARAAIEQIRELLNRGADEPGLDSVQTDKGGTN